MEWIQSKNNSRVVEACKLRDKKYRERHREFLLDGKKLYAEAVQSGVEICDIFVTKAYLESNPEIAENPLCIGLSDAVFAKLSQENAPEGIICRAKYIDFLHKFVTIYNIDPNDTSFFAVCEVRDPGNLGNVIRACRAFGIERLILHGCADLYNPKTVRAAMGGLFRQRITVCEDLSSAIAALRQAGIAVYAAALRRDAMPLDAIPQKSKVCFLLGNEGHGLHDSVIAQCDAPVFIPIAPDTESLNAANAATVLLWHIRQI